MKKINRLLLAGAVPLLLALSACGGGEELDSGDGDSGSDKGSLSIVGQSFTEANIVGEMYKQVLEDAGYTVKYTPVTDRATYLSGLLKGDYDVAQEYLSSFTDALNIEKNGADAASPATSDTDETLKVLTGFADANGLTPLTPSPATDQNAFFVTKDAADADGLKTLSDLAALKEPITLAATDACVDRADCQAGLEKVYGMDIIKDLPTGFGGTQTLQSVLDGESQLGLTGTTDGSLEAQGLVILSDDKGIVHAENLLPVVNSDFLKAHPDVADTLDKVSAALTTDDLASLNVKVDVDRSEPADVAKQYLEDKGIL